MTLRCKLDLHLIIFTMLAIAFWNVRKGLGPNIEDAIVDLAVAIATDATLSGTSGELLLGIGEPGNLDETALLKRLNSAKPNLTWWCHKSLGERFLCFGTVSGVSFTSEVAGCLPCGFARMQSGGGLKSYGLWFVHLASPHGAWDIEEHNRDVAHSLRMAIEKGETDSSNCNTIAIGDFNMTPHDVAMVSPGGLFAASCSHVAKGISRKINNVNRSYFYNPMWTLLGSWSPTRQPGSYYKVINTRATKWHLIDQVIVRPSLIDQITAGTPIILSMAGKYALTTKKGCIKSFSDHLPVAISLNI